VTAPADLVITGADVYRVDPARSWSDAVAVRGDRIVAVGSAAVRELTGPATTVLDLPGSLVLPGFQDAHIHPPFAGRNRRNIDLSAVSGREEYLRAIGEFAAAHPDREWIIGGGWAMEYFPGGTPRKEDLDAVVGDRPVFLFNRDVHGAWVNSAALRLAGITKHTPDPADGRIERDADTGEPTGALHEGAAYTFNDRVVPLPGVEEWQESILEAQRYLHTLGITGWQDAWVTPDTQQAYVALAEAERLSARVVGALWWDRHRGLEQIDELLDRAQGGIGRFHPRTVKIMVDGVLENYTGALLEPYCDGCGGHGDNLGLTYVEPELLTAAVRRLDAEGLQVHMHAIGDRAVRMALDAVQAARSANGRNDNRHHIAHLQVVQPADLPRFRQLGVVANCQTFWAQSEPQMDELTIPYLGPERAELQYPFADLLQSGATLAMGSDWGVTTADPLQQIEVAVRRVGPETRNVPAFLPEQRLPLPVAVAAFTAGSAYVNHDDEAGSIQVGRRADLAVVDRNIFDATAGLPADARVTHTIAAGVLVHGG
jgi:predicted amidohydrolase YtcJ